MPDSNPDAPLILIADDSQVSREYLANILIPAGYRVLQAIDGGSAFKVVTEHDVSLVIIDHYMQPHGGLEFARIVQGLNIDLPMIMVTQEETSDLLLEISKYGIGSFLKKPAEPARLLETIRRALRHKYGESLNAKDGQAFAATTVKNSFTHVELMRKAIDLAQKNLASGHGGPFGAVVADQDGKIIGEGVNGIMSRADPIAHAEVMAIRQATERLNRPSLENCILYSSGEPTRIGKALIDSVGIAKVFYALSHEEMARFHPVKHFSAVEYERLETDAARDALLSNS